jgi:hypothetical protein
MEIELEFETDNETSNTEDFVEIAKKIYLDSEMVLNIKFIFTD